MGDRGLGFLFVREALQGEVLKRFQYGDRQFADFQYHMFPYDPPGPPPATWKHGSGAGSFYEVGNIANVVAAGRFVGWQRDYYTSTSARQLAAVTYDTVTHRLVPLPLSMRIVEADNSGVMVRVQATSDVHYSLVRGGARRRSGCRATSSAG